MAAPDMEVIKDIPGYKVILKAVLKSQIQQLVEQLASTTDEESVILTASVADGTLSHLGSDSGKGFLEDHEDIKSQFLGFCLKRHHRQKHDEMEKREAEVKQFSMQASPGRYGATRFAQSGVQGQVHPVSIMHAGSVSSLGGNVRHEPYPVSRPSRRRSGSANTSLMVASSASVRTANDETIKKETEESDTVSNEGPSQTASTSLKSLSGANDDDSNTFSGEPGSESIDEGADIPNLIPGNNPENTESGGTDANVSVKLEALTESEMELEITGVEPARSMIPQDNWDPNISMAANYDPNTAVGSMSQQADSQKDQPTDYEKAEEVFKDYLTTRLLEGTTQDMEHSVSAYAEDEREKMKTSLGLVQRMDYMKNKPESSGVKLLKTIHEEFQSLRGKIRELEEDSDYKPVVEKVDVGYCLNPYVKSSVDLSESFEIETLDDKMINKMNGDHERFKFLCRKYFTDDDLRNCSRTGKKTVKSGETPRPPLDARQFEKLRQEVLRFCSFEEKVFLKKFENLQKVLRKSKREVQPY